MAEIGIGDGFDKLQLRSGRIDVVHCRPESLYQWSDSERDRKRVEVVLSQLLSVYNSPSNATRPGPRLVRFCAWERYQEIWPIGGLFVIQCQC